MIAGGRIADILGGPDQAALDELPRMLPDLTTPELFDLLELMEDPEIFRNRLPLRLKLYARFAEEAPDPAFRLLALLRLLRRLGSRKDVPDLGEIPEKTEDFAEYLARHAGDLCDDDSFASAVESLAAATRAYRSGDLRSMRAATEKGLKALRNVPVWENPPAIIGLIDLAVAETGHELTSMAATAAFRAGDVNLARELVDDWADTITAWEGVLGPLPRQRYQYYQLVGYLDYEVGLYEQALAAYSKALEYSPTPYRSAFLWLSQAQIERVLGQHDPQSWKHASDAIWALLASPYPQTAATWIEWLALDSDTPEKAAEIENMRSELEKAGGVEINRVTRAMTELYRLLAKLHRFADPEEIARTLNGLIDELEKAGSWPNLVTLLATRAVVAGRLNDRESMDEAIGKARAVMASRLDVDSRPPAEFLLESAHALALRDVGAYDEAFSALFERALEARRKYPGAYGPDERTAVEALYYLGALAGNDPDTIEKRIRDTIRHEG